MRIIKVEAIPVIIPFNTEWKISTVNDYGGGYVILKLHTDEGLVGIGEIGRWFDGESPVSIVDTCNKFFAPILMSEENPLNINKIMNQFRLTREKRFAKALVDIALHDLKAKKLGVPVYQLLGGAFRDKIELCQSLGIKSKEAIQRDLDLYLAQGFKAFKIKIGTDYEADVELVKMIREMVGPNIKLRVDANEGYHATTCINTLKKLEEYDLTLIEQPSPHMDIPGSRRIRSFISTPILLCEGANTIYDVFQQVVGETADIVNIKIGRPSGFIGSKQMEAVAKAAGLPVCIGTQLEMGVGTAACAHLAASIEDLVDTSDITGPTLLVDDIISEPLKFENGFLHVPQGVGLGVELDDDKIDFYRMDK